MNYPLITEYIEAIINAEDNFDQFNNLRPVLDNNGRPIMSGGNFAVVFKMKDVDTGKIHAVKCFLKEQEGRAEAYRQIAEELENVSSPYLTSIKYLDKELFVDSSSSDENEFPVLLMDWIDGQTLDKYVREQIDDEYELSMLAYRFSCLATWLLQQPFAHGDLKPDNILVKDDGSLVLVDYDGMYVPAMEGQKARELGSPDFRHPGRTEDTFDEHIDDFPLVSILLSLKAIALKPELLEQYGASDRLLFSENDYRILFESRVMDALMAMMQDPELSTLISLFILSISQKNLSQVSHVLLNLKRPYEPNYDPFVERFEWKNAWTDEYGVKYSADKRRLLFAPKNVKEYSIRKGTLVICDNAFRECKELVSIDIPSSIVVIGNGAFADCERIKSISLPNKIYEIYSSAFAGCKNLQSITIPDGVTYIGGSAFFDCNNLEEISIPDSVTEIQSAAFYGCSKLKTLSMPKCLEKIEDELFHGCESLKSIHLSNTIKEIGNSAFFGCKSLLSIDLPYNLETFAPYAFADCESLKDITIPNSVTFIGDSAFDGCKKLQKITISKSVSEIGYCVFRDCLDLEYIYIDKENNTYNSSNDCNAIIETRTYTLAVGCKNTIIPDNIKVIGDESFSGCVNLKSISIPCSVYEIGYKAFAGCSGLKSVCIPCSVKKISGGAFEQSGLSSVYIYDGLCECDKDVFNGCHNLSQIYIEKGSRAFFCSLFPDYKEKLIELDNFELLSSEVTSEDLANAWTDEYGVKYSSDKKRLLRAPGDIKDYYVRRGTMVICDGAFNNYTWVDDDEYPGYPAKEWFGELVSIIIPDSVKVIGNSAFENCSDLQFVKLSEGLTEIGNNAFKNCRQIAPIIIPNTVRSIGISAFFDCKKLASVTLSNRIESINNSIFYGCESLTSIIIPDNVKTIGDFAFYGCSCLEKINFSNNLISIGKGAFSSCYSLLKIKIPQVLGEIKENAFLGCTKIKSIEVDPANTNYDSRECCNAIIESNKNRLIVACKNTIIPQGVITIGRQSFFLLKEIKSLNLPDTLREIEFAAFSGCESLSSISIPKNVKAIDDAAFLGCKNLRSITIASKSIALRDRVFHDCNELSDIIIPHTNIKKYLLYDFQFKLAERSEDGVHLFPYTTEVTDADLKNAWKDEYGVKYSKDRKRLLWAPKQLVDYSIRKDTIIICDDAFRGCRKLLTLAIPQGIRIIGNRAFEASSIRSIVIPNSVIKIGGLAFYDCSSLTDIKLSTSLKIIGRESFGNCINLKSITIPEGVYEICDYAFHSCSALSSLTIPGSVLKIGDGAFEGCEALSSIVIPDGVTVLGGSLFYGCNSLRSVYIPDSVSAFGLVEWGDNVWGRKTFDECNSLESIYIPKGTIEKFSNLLPEYKDKLVELDAENTLV